MQYGVAAASLGPVKSGLKSDQHLHGRLTPAKERREIICLFTLFLEQCKEGSSLQRVRARGASADANADANADTDASARTFTLAT